MTMEGIEGGFWDGGQRDAMKRRRYLNEDI
jgi:hypothetical protein